MAVLVLSPSGTLLPCGHRGEHVPPWQHQSAGLHPPLRPSTPGVSCVLQPVGGDARGTAACGRLSRCPGPGTIATGTRPRGLLPLRGVPGSDEEVD